MMGSGSHSLWSMNSTPQPYYRLPLNSDSSSSSSSNLPQYDQNTSSFQTLTPWQDSHELPESWSQLLLEGFQEEEDRCSFSAFSPKEVLENWEELQSNNIVDLNQEISKKALAFFNKDEQIHELPLWGSILPPTSSPGSCITTSLRSSSCSSMFDFSSKKSETQSLQQAQSVECNSTSTTGSALKKAKVQLSSALPTIKVRKEKVGDRVTALHQLVSPFGKTDTASVLLEAIRYIRFLQSQIQQALGSPYLGNSTRSKRQPGEVEQSMKDLRSRGLCLVPVSSTLNFGGDNGADYWATSFGGDFH